MTPKQARAIAKEPDDLDAEAIRAEALEEAARWHDEQSESAPADLPIEHALRHRVYAAAIRALAEKEAGDGELSGNSGWLPIESAPKGRDLYVDLWVVQPKNGVRRAFAGRITDCHWAHDNWGWCRDGRSVCGLYYRDADGDWLHDPLSTDPLAAIATHWRPLPAPPRADRAEGADRG